MKLKMLILPVFMIVTVAFVSLTPTLCWSAIELFVHIDGIPGDSVDQQHPDWIEAVTYNEGLEAIASGHVVRAVFSPITFSTSVGKASTALREHALQGQEIDEVEIHLKREGQQEPFFYKVLLKRALVSSVGVEANSADDKPTETFALNFDEINWEYVSLSGDSHGGGTGGVQIGDADDDSFTTSQGDCNDKDSSVYPGALELCDYKDNDCNGQTDEDYIALGEECVVGVGECERSGVMICSADNMSIECGAVPGIDSQEICDGLDNDCDGAVDEDFVVGDLAGRSKSGKIQLTWTHVGAASYNVYRSTTEGGPYTLIANTTSTYATYLDTSVSTGTTYYYRVMSVCAGVEGELYGVTSATPSSRTRSR
jgi:type VI secretion system Hcp family effector